MKTIVLTGCTSILAATLILGLGNRVAYSRPQYKAQFLALYVKPDSKDPEEKAFADLVKETNCQACHEPGMKRKLRNRYGKELAFLFMLPNEKDKKKIDEALEKVAAIHIDEKDPKSPTYGELIKKGKLPGGDPKPAEEKK